MQLEDYTTGTASIANGSTALTGTGTAWEIAGFKAGDTFHAQGLVGIIASVDGDAAITLRDPWTGGAIVDGAYLLRFQPDNSRMQGTTRQLLDTLRSGFSLVGKSTTSLAIGTGAKTFDVGVSNLGWGSGARLRASSDANSANFMEGVVTAYAEGSVTLNVDLVGGAGTHADWTINLAGEPAGDADVAADTHAAVSKATPVDADEMPIADSAASFGLKKLTWANFKAAMKAGLGLRERLTATRNYYVRTDGNDANTGLVNSAAGAFKTIPKALAVVLGTLDLGGFNVVINVVAGTYTDLIAFTSPQVGAGNIFLSGDTTTPSNCTIDCTGKGPCITVDGAGCRLMVQGLKFLGTPSAFIAQNGGFIRTTGLNEFSTCSGHVIQATKAGIVEAVAPEIVSGTTGGAQYNVNQGGIVYCQTATWTISAGATRGVFAWASLCGIIYAYSNTWTGTLTAQKYNVSLNGIVTSNGGGANYFPGSAAGATATGGQYA